VALAAQLALVSAGQLDVAHEAARVEHEHDANLARRTQQRLDHALELGAVVVGRARAAI
jgi:hypothetical protein